MYGTWEKACIDRKVTNACIPPVPTNYTGPARNPYFRTCGGDRCTTHGFIEDCYPTRAELRGSPCEGQWVKVCLRGRVAERCLPAGPLDSFAATRFVKCGDGSCAVGKSRRACPR